MDWMASMTDEFFDCLEEQVLLLDYIHDAYGISCEWNGSHTTIGDVVVKYMRKSQLPADAVFVIINADGVPIYQSQSHFKECQRAGVPVKQLIAARPNTNRKDWHYEQDEQDETEFEDLIDDEPTTIP